MIWIHRLKHKHAGMVLLQFSQILGEIAMFISLRVPLSVWWSLFLPPCASPAFSVSALVDFRRGSCLSAILRQSRDPGVKECEPGAVTIETFPQGRQCRTPQQTPQWSHMLFVFLGAHLFPQPTIVLTLEWNHKKKQQQRNVRHFLLIKNKSTKCLYR